MFVQPISKEASKIIMNLTPLRLLAIQNKFNCLNVLKQMLSKDCQRFVMTSLIPKIIQKAHFFFISWRPRSCMLLGRPKE